MKRIVPLILALLLMMSLAACGEDGKVSFKPDDDAPTNTDASSNDNNSGKEDGSGDANGSEDVILPEDGLAVGYEGDTLRTAFFDMTIKNPRTSTEYDGLTADEGYKFLTADLTLYNYTDVTQPMFDTDFEVVWDLDDDDAWDFPMANETVGADGEPEYSLVSDTQLPQIFNLGIHRTETGVLLYQVPEDCTDFYIAFYEVFEAQEEGGEEEYGDAFFVRFSE